MAATPVLCRDCRARFAASAPARRCERCGSPRLVQHPELDTLAIAHVDCDAFYAAIEKRDDPRLLDLPVIVGGGTRGVVSTACYVARIRGVRSAMPMFKALELCPDAVVIKPNMAKYVAVGREVRAMMEALTPLVEPLSIDEAFLDLSGTEALHHAPPAAVLADFAARVERQVGITVSIGLSHNKFLAKLASDLDKPRGFAVIGRAETLGFLAPRPVTSIWGVGAKTAASLAREGFSTIGDLARADPKRLVERFGELGLRLARLSRGEDSRHVDPWRERKSVSAETTFDQDIASLAELEVILWKLSEKVARRLKQASIAGRTLTLKLKTADFRIITRSMQLPDPTQLADRIYPAARKLLAGEARGTRFRLIGVGLSELSDDATADPLDLIDPGATRRAKAEAAADRIKAKFGEASLVRGLEMRDGRRAPRRGGGGRKDP